MVKNITFKELNNIVNKNIIDIRSKDKYNISHVEGSINIPYDELIIKYDNYLDKNKEYYIYCDSGKRSLNICNFLNNKGYNLINIIGGYNSYLSTFGRR